MIKVNETYVDCEISDVILKLKQQLENQGFKRFYRSTDTPNNYMVCCPFHKDGQERKPSMGILKSDGTCHCFACGWVGSLPELVSNCLGYDDWGNYGSKWLIRNFISLEVNSRNDIDLQFSRKKTTVNALKYVSEEELNKYRYYHPYWKERGITDEYIINLFDLGYDASTQCITFPIRNIEGRCVFVAKRSVKTKYFHYPQGVEKPLYGLYELSELAKIHNGNWESEVVVCESMIDALTCWQYGSYAVALNGLGNELQFKQLRELPCRKLIIATDNDEAGMQAKERISKNVTNKILTQYVFPKNKKDINDLTREDFLSLNEIFL